MTNPTSPTSRPVCFPTKRAEDCFRTALEPPQRLLELATDSARSDAKHHALLVGPRGIGKTHLISLLTTSWWPIPIWLAG